MRCYYDNFLYLEQHNVKSHAKTLWRGKIILQSELLLIDSSVRPD